MLIADYLVAITGRQLHGQLHGNTIYRATGYELLPLQALMSTNVSAEAYLIALLRSHLNSSYLCFSYTLDLTRRLQAQFVVRPADVDKALWETVKTLDFAISDY